MEGRGRRNERMRRGRRRGSEDNGQMMLIMMAGKDDWAELVVCLEMVWTSTGQMRFVCTGMVVVVVVAEEEEEEE